MRALTGPPPPPHRATPERSLARRAGPGLGALGTFPSALDLGLSLGGRRDRRDSGEAPSDGAAASSGAAGAFGSVYARTYQSLLPDLSVTMSPKAPAADAVAPGAAATPTTGGGASLEADIADLSLSATSPAWTPSALRAPKPPENPLPPSATGLQPPAALPLVGRSGAAAPGDDQLQRLKDIWGAGGGSNSAASAFSAGFDVPQGGLGINGPKWTSGSQQQQQQQLHQQQQQQQQQQHQQQQQQWAGGAQQAQQQQPVQQQQLAPQQQWASDSQAPPPPPQQQMPAVAGAFNASPSMNGEVTFLEGSGFSADAPIYTPGNFSDASEVYDAHGGAAFYQGGGETEAYDPQSAHGQYAESYYPPAGAEYAEYPYSGAYGYGGGGDGAYGAAFGGAYGFYDAAAAAVPGAGSVVEPVGEGALASINGGEACSELASAGANARYFVLRCYSTDEVLKSVKYGLWAAPRSGHEALHYAFLEASAGGAGPVYLFVMVSGSGHFSGVCEMVSPIQSSLRLVSSVRHLDRWETHFHVRWLLYKSLPHKACKHITLTRHAPTNSLEPADALQPAAAAPATPAADAAPDLKPVSTARDGQEVFSAEAAELLQLMVDAALPAQDVAAALQQYDERRDEFAEHRRALEVEAAKRPTDAFDLGALLDKGKQAKKEKTRRKKSKGNRSDSADADEHSHVPEFTTPGTRPR